MSTNFNEDDMRLSSMFRADQDIEATAGKVAGYYKRLVDGGVPEEAAIQMTLTYNALVVAAHYELDLDSVMKVYPDWED